MSPHVFAYDEFYSRIERFALDVPAILAGHHTTADLSPQLYGLLDAIETVFTVAVVGQMRSGKSSLLNALVGADLAVTGVTETTATVNHFIFGAGEKCQRFRVYWKDRPAEEFPCSEIQKWVGDSDRARATRRIEFFADVEFLRRANVVDTPGTRSVLTAHEDTVQDFLAAKHDADTRRQGGAADAIIYVLGAVARKADQELLSDFETNTRLPGATPYNSLAVIHKWETLSVDDPLSEVHCKAQRISAALGDLVSEVIPVSAPLARAAEHFPDAFWSQILDLATNCPGDVMEELLLTDRDFLQAVEPRCPLSPPARQALHSTYNLPWPSLKMIVRHARSKQPGNVADLRSAIHEASGIDVLRNRLQQRFFARTKMIKAFSILSKAWEPCQTANVRLRYHKTRYTRLADAAQDAMRSISECADPDAHLATVQRYLEETRSLVEADLLQAGDVLRRLGDAVVTLQDAYEDMNKDLRMLELLDVHEKIIGADWARTLRHLFGYTGPETENRIRPILDECNARDGLNAVARVIGELRRKCRNTKGDVREVFEHGLSRLEQIADWLEEQKIRLPH